MYLCHYYRTWNETKKLKRILHINSNTEWRGAEQQIQYIIQQKTTHLEHYLFCVKDGELYKRNQNKNTIGYNKRFGMDLVAAMQLKKTVRLYKIDVLHLHDSHAINTYFLAYCLGLNIPCIIHKHVNFPIKNKWKYTLKNIQKIICVSEAAAQKLMEFIPLEKIVIIPPAINIQNYQKENNKNINPLKLELKLDENAILIGIIAALEKEKNIEEFIKIANILIEKEKKYHFIIIGDGVLKPSYQNTNANIHFLGFKNEVPILLACLNIFLFTSKNEGFGQVILEAMATKIPIVCRNYEAAQEIIQHQKNGYLYNSIQEAIKYIEEIFKQTKQTTLMVENAFETVQQYDVSLILQKMETIYLNIKK